MSRSIIKMQYVSKKVSKVRWKPGSDHYCVAGSHDDEENCLYLWNLNKVLQRRQDTDGDLEDDPILSSVVNISGSVTEIKMLREDLFFVSTSLGSLHLYTFSEESLVHERAWEKIHYSSQRVLPVTGIDICGEEVATVGADERICVFNYVTGEKVTEIAGEGFCSYTAVNYLKQKELVVSNSLGEMKLWDTRCSTNMPTKNIFFLRGYTGISSMAVHPCQNHILATGHNDGSLYIWDMRYTSFPSSKFEGHSEAISEMLFHPASPDNLFTCSWDGQVWQWNASEIRLDRSQKYFQSPSPAEFQPGLSMPWIYVTPDEPLEITSFSKLGRAAVNSLDVKNYVLMWGTDSEAICVVEDIYV